MILYFSGTGNSEYAARRISTETKDKLMNLGERIRSRDFSGIHSDTPWVVAAPTYAWRIPRVLEEWLKNTELRGNKNIYFVMTCGGNIGNAGRYLKKLALSLDGLAGGAATAGCCAQMIGFAVMSYRENKIGGLMAQGLGTSMLQMGNIVLNPRIWIPPTLASMITGPIATMVFRLENIPAGSGMGTCGLVGPIGVYTAMGGGTSMWVGILLVCFLLPAVLTFVFGEVLRRMGWIKDGDLKLDL